MRKILDTDQQSNFCTFFGNMDIGEGKHVTVQDIEDIRTLEQQALLWVGLYRPIAEQISEANNVMLKRMDIHKFLKDKFGPRVIYTHPLTGVKSSEPKSTTKYTRKETSDYLEQGFAWGAQNGVWFA